MRLHNPLNVLRTDTKVDVFGDLHGCHAELELLLAELGWTLDAAKLWEPPTGRIAAFVGDLINRGPRSFEVLQLVWRLVQAGRAVAVLGNHDALLLRWLLHPELRAPDLLRDTIAELVEADQKGEALTLEKARLWLEGAPLSATFHLDDARMVVVHAAWHPALEVAPPEVVAAACLYGPTASLPGHSHRYRVDWRRSLPEGCPLILHGHTAYNGPVYAVGPTRCLDTACVFGGRLTALRWPSMEMFHVKPSRAWAHYPKLPSAPPLYDPSSLPEGQALAWPWNPDGPRQPL